MLTTCQSVREPRIVFQGDWRIRARTNVGWDRPPSLPNEWLDSLQLEPELRFIHLRVQSKKQLRGRMRNGYGQYFMGTGLLFIVASSIYRDCPKRMAFCSNAMIWGWLKAALEGKPRRMNDSDAFFLHTTSVHRVSAKIGINTAAGCGLG
jgi:hypothetical protein